MKNKNSLIIHDLKNIGMIDIEFTPLEFRENTMIISQNSEMSWDKDGNVFTRNLKELIVNNIKIQDEESLLELIKINKKNTIGIIFEKKSSGSIRINNLIDSLRYRTVDGINIKYHKLVIGFID